MNVEAKQEELTLLEALKAIGVHVIPLQNGVNCNPVEVEQLNLSFGHLLDSLNDGGGGRFDAQTQLVNLVDTASEIDPNKFAVVFPESISISSPKGRTLPARKNNGTGAMIAARWANPMRDPTGEWVLKINGEVAIEFSQEA